MLIGMDFDNTIAGYDRLFASLALEAGLFETPPAGGKTVLRDALRSRGEEGEVAWQHLQALAYGPRMDGAVLLDGVAAFMATARRYGAGMVVVSHKTRYARRDPERRWDMQQASLAWMERHGFFGPDGLGLTPEQVFFADSRDEKVARIGELGCTHFIDDLEEVLEHPAFPVATRRYRLAPDAAPVPGDGTGTERPFHQFRSWHDIRSTIFPWD